MLKPSVEQVTAALEAAGQPFGVINYPGGIQLIIAEYGGRLYGPFVDGEPLVWLNPALADAAEYQAYVASGEWNLGGERVWIAPELQYNVSNREDFWGTHVIPPQMDPGSYHLSGMDGDAWGLAQSMTLTAHNLATGEVNLDLRRVARPANNPLTSINQYEALMEDTLFAGYQQDMTLTDTKDSAMMSEVWDIVQLNPGGQLYIPTTGGVGASVYFGDPPAQVRNTANGMVRVNITGQNQFKVGYKSAYLTGRLGYLNALDDSRAYLMVRSFFNDPSSIYPEEPPTEPGNRGHPVHVYNDGGQFGGFGELECNGRTIGGESGRNTSTDTFTMWVYVGTQEKLLAIANVLLGVTV